MTALHLTYKHNELLLIFLTKLYTSYTLQQELFTGFITTLFFQGHEYFYYISKVCFGGLLFKIFCVTQIKCKHEKKFFAFLK